LFFLGLKIEGNAAGEALALANPSPSLRGGLLQRFKTLLLGHAGLSIMREAFPGPSHLEQHLTLLIGRCPAGQVPTLLCVLQVLRCLFHANKTNNGTKKFPMRPRAQLASA
jgi:hypothetical protein